MDYLEPQLKRFLPTVAPKYPLPWHDWGEAVSHRHLETHHYARIMLDALAGDERRAPLRRVYRFYRLHAQMYDKERTTALWMLIEALKEYMHILAPGVAKSLVMQAANLKGL